jgi:hypothetical protein
VNAVNLYSTVLFKDIGVSAGHGSALVGVSQVAGVLVGSQVLKSLKYRTIFIAG